MSERVTTTRINRELCTGCGLCATVCPDNTISINGDKAEVTGEKCLHCGHCVAVCPENAVSVEAIDPEGLVFNSFTLDDQWLKWGDFAPAELVRLMASRRSCRNFRDRPVSRETLEDLIKIGTTAPSGTNSQKWTFTVLEDREQVVKLGDRVALFFVHLNKMATNPLLRLYSKLFGGNTLGRYYQRYYDSVSKGLQKWRKEGRDLLFHGAPAVILIGSAPGASCPAEDALLASQNILLGAHALGLGTCLIGFTVTAMQHDPTIKDIIRVDRDEKIYSVIALGYPNEQYRRLVGRRKPVIRFPELH